MLRYDLMLGICNAKSSRSRCTEPYPKKEIDNSELTGPHAVCVYDGCETHLRLLMSSKKR